MTSSLSDRTLSSTSTNDRTEQNATVHRSARLQPTKDSTESISTDDQTASISSDNRTASDPRDVKPDHIRTAPGSAQQTEILNETANSRPFEDDIYQSLSSLGEPTE